MRQERECVRACASVLFPDANVGGACGDVSQIMSGFVLFVCESEPLSGAAHHEECKPNTRERVAPDKQREKMCNSCTSS